MGPEALAQVLRPLAGMFDPARYPDLLQGLNVHRGAVTYRAVAEALDYDYRPATEVLF